MGLKNKIQLIKKVNLIKSIYYSIKFNSRIIIGYGTILHLERKTKILVDKGGLLFIGVYNTIPSKTVLDIYYNGILKIHGTAKINKGCKIMIGENAILSIGNNSFINEQSRIHCREKITIGNDCAIAWQVNILDTDEHKLYINNSIISTTNPVSIGNKVWIGLNSTILKGCIIEENVIIGASSLVTKGRYLSDNIYAGNPCKKIKDSIYWEK